MLLNVKVGIVFVILLLLLTSFTWLLLTKLLFDPFSQVRVNVLSQVILTVEAFTTLGAPVHLICTVNYRMPLKVLLCLMKQNVKIMTAAQICRCKSYLSLEGFVAYWARMRSFSHV